MTITFTTLPFEVLAGKRGGIVIQEYKTGQSWSLSNRDTRQFVRLIGRRRRLAECLADHANSREPDLQPDGDA
jgi:hypothetical protein